MLSCVTIEPQESGRWTPNAAAVSFKAAGFRCQTRVTERWKVPGPAPWGVTTTRNAGGGEVSFSATGDPADALPWAKVTPVGVLTLTV